MKRLLAAALALAACGPGDRPDGNNPGTDGGVDAGPPVDGPPSQDVSRVYAHNRNSLYRLNAQTLTATPIGVMAGLGGEALLDLAVDQNDRILGISDNALWEINATTGATTQITTLAAGTEWLTSLSFVPGAGSSDPDRLVAAGQAGRVYEINQATGVATEIGSYGMYNGQVVGSSGDLFGVRGLGIFATVNVGTGANSVDYLARIDPSNGWRATPLPQSTSFDKVFGLGYWNGKIYGFVDAGNGAGKIIEINSTSGAAFEVNAGAIPWFGAGVATNAPIL